MTKKLDYFSETNCEHVDVEELLLMVKTLNNAKTPGPDCIPIELYKWLRADTADCKIIAKLVCKLINQCIDEENNSQKT